MALSKMVQEDPHCIQDVDAVLYVYRKDKKIVVRYFLKELIRGDTSLRMFKFLKLIK
jgi:hypothetical protein